MILGDIFDRGPETRELYDFLMSIPEDRLLLVRGNHEDLLYSIFFKKFDLDDIDLFNGTLRTIADFTKLVDPENLWDAREEFDLHFGAIRKKMEPIFSLMHKAKDYIELGNYIFVHGWIPSVEKELHKNIYDPNWRDATRSEWVLARWDNGMEMANLRYIRER